LLIQKKIAREKFRKHIPSEKKNAKAIAKEKKDPRSPEGECLRISAGGRLCETGERGKTDQPSPNLLSFVPLN
jgi:hypothetical protein